MKIIDVSKWQGRIDWKSAASEVEMAILRASIGFTNGEDERYAEYAKGCRDNKIPFGAYHWLLAKTDVEARREADLFASLLKREGARFAALDMEYDNLRPDSICVAFIKRLDELGIPKLGLYTGQYILPSLKETAALCDWIWIARYGKNDGTVSRIPDVACDLHQYTSVGKVPGISTNVDINRIAGSKPLSWWTGDAAEEEQDEQSSADRVIAQATKWLGYVEKASDKSLDDFAANPGFNNYTRFGRDYVDYMGEGTKNMEWCAAFVSCVFAYEFGLAEAKRLLSGNLHCYTPYGATLMKNQGRYTKRGVGTPRRGDVVWFYSPDKGRIGHVGIVEKVEGGRVYTIEGNIRTTTASQGGQVARKSYSLDYQYIDGYGRPPYDIESVTPASLLGARMLRYGNKGEDVRELQNRLNKLGYSCGTADGIFGVKTRTGVRNFQKAKKLTVDGIFGPKSLNSLNAT